MTQADHEGHDAPVNGDATPQQAAPQAPPAWPQAAPPGAPTWPGAAPGPTSQQAAPQAPPAWPQAAPPGPPEQGAYPGAYYSAPQQGQGTPPRPAIPTYRSWQPGIIALRPLNFGDFVTVPFRAMRFNRAVVVGAPLMLTLVSTTLTMIAWWMVFNDSLVGLSTASPSMSGLEPQTIAVIVIALAVVALTDLLASAIIAPGVARAVLGERITPAAAWAQVQRRLGSLALLYVATLIGALLLMALAASPLLLFLSGDAGSSTVGLVLTALFFLALIPVFVAGGVIIAVTRVMIVLEGVSFPVALRRTLTLIKGRFWWSILIVFVCGALIGTVAGMLQSMGQAMGTVLGLALPASSAVNTLAFIAAFGITYALSTTLTYSYLGSAYSLIYIDLRIRHEGFDVDLARAAEARASQPYGPSGAV